MSEQFQYADQTLNKLTINADVSTLTNDKDAVTVKYVQNKFDALVGTSPSVLDTIQEIAAALNNDPSILNVLSTNLSNAINTEVTNRNTAIQEATANVASSLSETTDSLQSQLTSEIANRNSAITTAVSVEATSRQTADTNIGNALQSEVALRNTQKTQIDTSLSERMPKAGGTFSGSVVFDDYLNFGTRWRLKGSSDGKRLVFEYCQAGDNLVWKTAIPFIQSN